MSCDHDMALGTCPECDDFGRSPERQVTEGPVQGSPMPGEEHDPGCDSTEVGPNLGPSTKPCNCRWAARSSSPAPPAESFEAHIRQRDARVRRETIEECADAIRGQANGATAATALAAVEALRNSSEFTRDPQVKP